MSPECTSASGPPAAASGADVQNHRSVGGAAHARIGNADHIGDAFTQQFGGQQHVAHFRHARITARSAILQHHDASFHRCPDPRH